MNEEYPDLPFVPPKSYSTGRPNGSPRLIVVHYTAGSEGPSSAEDGASYDQRRTDGTSAHYYVDQNSIVQCVYTWNRAHTAFWNGNQVGIHYELCGTVQNRAQWLDAASLATIRRAATQIRRDMAKYSIPAVKLTAQQVRDGYRGICGHAEVTAAWPEDGGDHTDPGVEFPWDVLISAIQEDEDDMSQRASNAIEAWSVGSPKAADGYDVAPVIWQQRRECWQAEVSTQLVVQRSELQALTVAFRAMAAAISAGGGNIETSAILAKMAELADLDRAREEQLLAQIRGLESMLAERDARLATALTAGVSTGN